MANRVEVRYKRGGKVKRLAKPYADFLVLRNLAEPVEPIPPLPKKKRGRPPKKTPEPPPDGDSLLDNDYERRDLRAKE